MKTPEGNVKADIKKLLDSYEDELYYFMPVQMGMGKRAVDFLICYRGQFIACETKRKGGRARKHQERIIHEIEGADGIGLCVDSASELQKTLENIKFYKDVARPST